MESGREAYNPSTGSKINGSTFNIKYGAGYAKGSVYADKVTLGGITVDQSIGCATDVDSDDVGDRNLDGLVGLGFDSGCVLPHNGQDAQPSATKSALNSGMYEVP
jgi:aspergillopepsin I